MPDDAAFNPAIHASQEADSKDLPMMYFHIHL